METDGKIIGHIMFISALVGNGIVLALALLSVLPGYQRRGNARPESGGRRRLSGDVLRLSMVDRAPEEKYLCCRRKQRQCNLCGSEQEDGRCGFFVFQAYCI